LGSSGRPLRAKDAEAAVLVIGELAVLPPMTARQ